MVNKVTFVAFRGGAIAPVAPSGSSPADNTRNNHFNCCLQFECNGLQVGSNDQPACVCVQVMRTARKSWEVQFRWPCSGQRWPLLSTGQVIHHVTNTAL